MTWAVAPHQGRLIWMTSEALTQEIAVVLGGGNWPRIA